MSAFSFLVLPIKVLPNILEECYVTSLVSFSFESSIVSEELPKVLVSIYNNGSSDARPSLRLSCWY